MFPFFIFVLNVLAAKDPEPLGNVFGILCVIFRRLQRILSGGGGQKFEIYTPLVILSVYILRVEQDYVYFERRKLTNHMSLVN